jgi:hypothetical protein
MYVSTLPYTARCYYLRLSPHVVLYDDSFNESVSIACKVCKTVKSFNRDFAMNMIINVPMEQYCISHRHAWVDTAGDEDYSYVLLAER